MQPFYILHTCTSPLVIPRRPLADVGISSVDYADALNRRRLPRRFAPRNDILFRNTVL